MVTGGASRVTGQSRTAQVRLVAGVLVPTPRKEEKSGFHTEGTENTEFQELRQKSVRAELVEALSDECPSRSRSDPSRYRRIKLDWTMQNADDVLQLQPQPPQSKPPEGLT